MWCRKFNNFFSKFFASLKLVKCQPPSLTMCMLLYFFSENKASILQKGYFLFFIDRNHWGDLKYFFLQIPKSEQQDVLKSCRSAGRKLYIAAFCVTLRNAMPGTLCGLLRLWSLLRMLLSWILVILMRTRYWRQRSIIFQRRTITKSVRFGTNRP